MGSTPRPLKTTPPNLNLAPKGNIRMPFSSPMGEEILSPASTSNQPQSPLTPIKRRRKGTLDAVGQENLETGNPKSRVPKSPRRDSSRKEEKPPEKPRWPGLNVVTNFSKPPHSAEAEARNRARRKDSRGQEVQPRFVALSDLRVPVDEKAQKDINTHKRNQSSGGHNVRSHGDRRLREEINRKKGRNEAAGVGLEELDNPPDYDSLMPPNEKLRADTPDSSKLTELSPSDRPIMIGIAVPSADLAEHAISPEGGPTPIALNNVIQSDRDPPVTPTIIVTPAVETNTWSGNSNEQSHSQHGRRAQLSSPLKNTFSHSFGDELDTIARPRVVSSCTIFDEDEVKARPSSGESQLRIFKRSSTDTVATRHRSQGWWTHILSPFISRSNGSPFKSPGTDEPVPALPAAYQGNLRDQFIKDADAFSPSRIGDETPKDHTTIYTDLSPDGRRNECETEIIPGPSPLSARDLGDMSNLNTPSPFEGFGAAAEYYNACWHDENSPNPYFRCQNHSCASKRSDQTINVTLDLASLDADTLNGTPREVNPGLGLSRVEGHEDSQLYGFQQAPGNRFSAAFNQAVKSKATPRALSEFTDIEDLDIVSTPEVSEAHIAPFLRAGVPVLAAQPVLVDAGHTLQKVMPGEENTPEPAEISRPPRISSRQASVTARSSQPKPDGAPPPSMTNLRKSSSAARPPLRPRAAYQSQTSLDQPLTARESSLTRHSSMRSSSSRNLADNTLSTQKPPNRSGPIMPPGFSWQEQPSASEPRSSIQRSREIPLIKPPMAATSRGDEPQPAQSTYVTNHFYNDANRRTRVEKDIRAGSQRLSRLAARKADVSWEKRERGANHEDRKSRKWLGSLICFKRDKPMNKSKKRLLCGVTLSLIILIILIVVLAMTLTQRSSKTRTDKTKSTTSTGGPTTPSTTTTTTTQWLNITGFPPIPTGISSIIQPDLSLASSKCVQPDTMWSCAVPKEEQLSIAPNQPDQPNFTVEIGFGNETSTSSTSTKSNKRSHTAFTVAARNFIRSQFLHIRDTFTSSSFSPNPSPPSQEDQAFLGNSTDQNASPFDGEPTPFFLSVISPSKPSTERLLKRADANNSFPDLTTLIPPPDVNSDGTAASANLYPFPTSQPLRLYDRGLTTEHYGFYQYFDRSIFLKSTALLDDTTTSIGDVPDDKDGGSTKSAATVRCTWAQTRFLVQIWTKQGTGLKLLGNPSPSRNLTAADTTRPGSFPYPVTVTLDRHGGDISKKMIYCYGLDNRERINSTRKKLQLEDRGAGGVLVNPALGPFATTKILKKDGGPGGIDGGTGGCGCRWTNFEGGL